MASSSSLSEPHSFPTRPSLSSERFSIFDSYICREPAGDLSLLMRNGPDKYTGHLRDLQRAAEYFTERDQARVVERIHYEQALLHIQHQNWKHAMRILFPLWQNLTWRKSGWWLLLEEVDKAMGECAERVNDADTFISVQWELLNNSLTPRQDTHTKISEAVRRLRPLGVRPKPQLRAENILCCVSAGLAFTLLEGNVGLPLPYQLVLKSHAQRDSPPVTIQSLQATFEGGLRGVRIGHENINATGPLHSRQDIHLQDVVFKRRPVTSDDIPVSSIMPTGSDLLHGVADLTLAAGHTIVLCLSEVPRNAENVEIGILRLSITDEEFDLELVITEKEDTQQELIYVKSGDRVMLKPLARDRSNAVKILPKPPKLKLELSALTRELFIDEITTFNLNIINNEDEIVDVKLELQVLGEASHLPTVRWLSSQAGADSDDERHGEPHNVTDIMLEQVLASTSQSRNVQIIAPTQPSEHTLSIKAKYFIKSYPENPIFVSIEKGILVRHPFDSTHTFSPLLHPGPWPSYFEMEKPTQQDPSPLNSNSDSKGLVQAWSLTSRIVSLASVELLIENAEVETIGIHGAAHCKVTGSGQPHSQLLPPGEMKESHFTIEVQNLDLEDRRPMFIDLRLKLQWRVQGLEEPVIVTYLPIQELAISFGEPRVLASASSLSRPPSAVQLQFIIENPSIYTLTLSLMMETGDDFAFSGTKNMTVQLVPLSRQFLRYHLLPLVKDTWISPQLRVYDVTFHKTLRVQGIDGVRNDKKGTISIWVDSLGDD